MILKLGSAWIYALVHVLASSSLKVSNTSKLTPIDMRNLFIKIALIYNNNNFQNGILNVTEV